MMSAAPVLSSAVPARADGPGLAVATVSIIPAYNEAPGIGALLAYLRQATAEEPDLEIIVADGGSTDGTRALARRAGATVVRSPRKGRAAQLNYGASRATGDILYFLHADSYPPPGFVADLRRARQQGYGSGCYRLAFDHGHWFLRFSAWCTRLPLLLLRFGDQSLFVQRELFAQVGGFREDLLVMEDQEIVRRLQAPGAVSGAAAGRHHLGPQVFGQRRVPPAGRVYAHCQALLAGRVAAPAGEALPPTDSARQAVNAPAVGECDLKFSARRTPVPGQKLGTKVKERPLGVRVNAPYCAAVGPERCAILIPPPLLAARSKTTGFNGSRSGF